MARKLKVFQAQLGFYDTVIAAPSQAAALRAWETGRNLFADGVAKAATDPKAIEAALAQPEIPLRRAVGTDDPFGLDAGTPRLPEEAKAPARTKTPKTAKKVALPDRSALDAAEARLRSIQADRSREVAELEKRDEKLSAEEQAVRARRLKLDAEKADASERHNERQSEAEAALGHARKSYKKGLNPRGR